MVRIGKERSSAIEVQAFRELLIKQRFVRAPQGVEGMTCESGYFCIDTWAS